MVESPDPPAFTLLLRILTTIPPSFNLLNLTSSRVRGKFLPKNFNAARGADPTSGLWPRRATAGKH